MSVHDPRHPAPTVHAQGRNVLPIPVPTSSRMPFVPPATVLATPAVPTSAADAARYWRNLRREPEPFRNPFVADYRAVPAEPLKQPVDVLVRNDVRRDTDPVFPQRTDKEITARLERKPQSLVLRTRTANAEGEDLGCHRGVGEARSIPTMRSASLARSIEILSVSFDVQA